MKYYTERHGMREPIEKSYDITPNKYRALLRCCEKYYVNIAWKYPEECSDGLGYYGLSQERLAEEIEFEIPDLFIDMRGHVGVPLVIENIFSDGPDVEEYNQFALLDFIEHMAENIRDVQKGDYHKFFNHYHLITKDTKTARLAFINEMNDCFKKTNLLYLLNQDGEVERVIENDVITPDVIETALSVNEKGTRDLLKEAIALHRSHDPNAARDSVEKLWDAFERLKTYYTHLDKKGSVEQIINSISGGKQEYIKLFNDEFKQLTDIGNDYRIRHHETNKIDIEDTRYYDYLFNRCFSLVALTVQYLD